MDTVIVVEWEARAARPIYDVVARLEAAGFRVERTHLD
jgi:tRNA G26 N,N-dimethylase Trm1